MSEPTLKDRIRNKTDHDSEIMIISKWDNEKIEVRSMMGSDRSVFMDTCFQESGDLDKKISIPFLIIGCCFDPTTGEKLFSLEDEEWLMTKNSTVLEGIATTALKVSGLTTGAVEGAEKNSDSATPPDTSSSS